LKSTHIMQRGSPLLLTSVTVASDFEKGILRLPTFAEDAASAVA
jgi:hypothetical protein